MKRNQGERKEWVTLNSINTEFEDFCNMVKTNIHQKERQTIIGLGKNKGEAIPDIMVLT